MKKTATTPKKMTLSRETLALLADSELKTEVLGGYSNRCTTSVNVCCP